MLDVDLPRSVIRHAFGFYEAPAENGDDLRKLSCPKSKGVHCLLCVAGRGTLPPGTRTTGGRAWNMGTDWVNVEWRNGGGWCQGSIVEDGVEGLWPPRLSLLLSCHVSLGPDVPFVISGFVCHLVPVRRRCVCVCVCFFVEATACARGGGSFRFLSPGAKRSDRSNSDRYGQVQS